MLFLSLNVPALETLVRRNLRKKKTTICFLGASGTQRRRCHLSDDFKATSSADGCKERVPGCAPGRSPSIHPPQTRRSSHRAGPRVARLGPDFQPNLATLAAERRVGAMLSLVAGQCCQIGPDFPCPWLQPRAGEIGHNLATLACDQ